MPFNLETWKAQASQRLGEAKTWLGRRASENAPLLAYSTLGMLCLAPLANALANPNMTTMIEAAMVLSGLGSNLLAGELQKWKDAPADKRDETLREALVASLQMQNEHSQQLRNELDKVLQMLDALSETRKHLPPAEQPNFAAQWQQDAQRIGSQVTIQGDWMQVDITAEQVNIAQQTVHHHYTTPDPALKYAEIRRNYLKWLVNEVNRVPLQEVDPQQNNPKADAIQLKLCDVYIGLDTTRAGSALKAVLNQPKTVLTGEPGSGKSTFVHHLIYSLALHQLAPDPAQLQAFYKVWKAEVERKRLPVRVILRDFDAWLRSQSIQSATTKCLLDFIAQVLGDNGQSEAFEMLQTELKQGAVLLVLDGLDEVTQFSQRKLMRDIITEFADTYVQPDEVRDGKRIPAPQNRYVLTCRTRSYEAPAQGREDVRVPQFDQYELMPFGEAKIEAFVHAWYAELFKAGRFSNASSADAKRDKLLPQLQKPEFRRMAGNPLQLTLMAWVHTEDELPERRAQLYERAIDLLLWHRESKKEGLKRLHNLLEGLEDAKRRVRAVLAEAAYLAHAQISPDDQANNREKLADVSESGLVAALAALRDNEHGQPDKAWAQQMVDAICDRSGLLARRVENSLTFPHRTFQEYLAACHLIKLPKFVDEALRLTADANGLAVWREVILLAVGKDVYVDDQYIGRNPEILARKMYKRALTLQDDLFFAALTAFGAAVLGEIGLPGAVVERELDADLLREMRLYLQTYISTSTHPPEQRTVLGDALAQLGDPRFYGSDKLCLPVEPDLGLIKVPAGAFYMGTRQADAEQMTKQLGWDRSWFEDEIWGEALYLDTYYLARYPTTVAQFRVFCHATDNGGFKPRDTDCLADPDTRPVRYVSWREAMRYCQWLNERLKTLTSTPEWLRKGLLEGCYVVTLPNEAQWEKAARGGVNDTDNPRRIFTYGDQSDPNCANCDDTHIKTTSAVGCFTGGQGPYGHHDLLGNVLEWQWSEYQPYPFKHKQKAEKSIFNMKSSRVVRGGSFYYGRRWARCAYRDRNLPENRSYYLGFRVVVSPVS